MRPLLALTILLTSSSPVLATCQQESMLEESSLEDTSQALCLFARPLVLGASVSAGFGVERGPATRLSQLMNPGAQIRNRAVSGATSVQSTRGLQIPRPAPSIVLGLDLFFWDAVRNSCGEEFISNAARLFEQFRSEGIPMVVGKIPTRVSFPQGISLAANLPCTRVINRLIDTHCTRENNCLAYDPGDCLRAMGSAVGPRGEAYFRDPLHTSDAGNEFCAQHFRQSAPYRRLRCPR
jgi:hypothetical protein